jgi:hypothetical protein
MQSSHSHSHAPDEFWATVPLAQVGDEHDAPIGGTHPEGGARSVFSGDFATVSDRIVVGLAATKRFSEKARVKATATIANRNSRDLIRRDLMGDRFLRVLVASVRLGAHYEYAHHREGTATSLDF